MKSLRTILAALLSLTLPAAGQTIKSLGYNTTNGNIVYSGTNPLTFTNIVTFSNLTVDNIFTLNGLVQSGTQNASIEFNDDNLIFVGTQFQMGAPIIFNNSANAATTRTNLGLGATWLTNNNVTNFRTAIGLGTTNSVAFNGVTAQNFLVSGQIDFDQPTNAVLTRENLGLGATNSPTFSNLTLSGTLTAASIATSTPVSWSLDAIQTAADTNGVIDLPLNANVLRITNANTISAITNGRLGAFYYIVNQSGTNLVLSNSATLTTRGDGTVTLAPNQSATLLSTSATNATLQGGPSQLDSPTFAGLTTSGTLTATGNVTMSGTANTAPNQTAASGSSIMTRDLSDDRYAPKTIDAFVVDDFFGGGVSANFVGDLGWYASGGATWGYGTFFAEHPGVWKLQNSSITNGKAALETASFGTRNREWAWQWTFKLNKITQARWAFGNFPTDISARSAAGGHFGVYYDSTNSSNWHVYVSNGATNTVTDTGVAATTNWAAIRMSYIGTNLTVAIANSNLVFGSPVSIPTTAFGPSLAHYIPGVFINNLDGTAQSIELDRVWMYGRFPNRD